MKRLITCDDKIILQPGYQLLFSPKNLQEINLYKLTKQIKQANSYKIYSYCLSTLAKLVNLVSIWFIRSAHLVSRIVHLKFIQFKEPYNTKACVSTAFPTI